MDISRSFNNVFDPLSINCNEEVFLKTYDKRNPVLPLCFIRPRCRRRYRVLVDIVQLLFIHPDVVPVDDIPVLLDHPMYATDRSRRQKARQNGFEDVKCVVGGGGSDWTSHGI